MNETAAASVRGHAALEAEGSVPLDGFSRQLRGAADVERYWFSFALRGDVALPVHIVFSPSQRKAEVRAADLKVWAIEGAASAHEAQGRWIEWWRGRSNTGFVAPRRSGRSPRAASGSS